MRSISISVFAFITLLCSSPTSAAPLTSRQTACFIIGNTPLPAEVSTAAASLTPLITCNPALRTIGGAPDVTSGPTTFSSINFADPAISNSQPALAFALKKFATASPLASTDLATLQDQLNVYVATEVALRSVGGSLAIKAPKFFLGFQVARVKTAQGVAIEDPGQTVEHLLGKVVKNAGSGESKETLDAIRALAGQLS